MKIQSVSTLLICLGILYSCTNNQTPNNADAISIDQTKETYSIANMVNIPAGMPHAFKNLGKKTANLVVIFPSNIWKYDVLDYFPFKSDTGKPVSRFTAFKNGLAKK